MMKLVTRYVLPVIVCLAIGVSAWAMFATEADEEKVPLDKVPAKVIDAVKAKFKGAELVGAEKETADGKVSYEIEIKNKGQKIDVIVSEDGKITAAEATIDVKDVPKVVTEALLKKYPNAKITSAEEITKDTKVTYEMVITAGGKTLEVVFDPQGKFLDEEDKSKEKDEKKGK
jgi:Putative beta-lactamase-inhibitor-like, PepSY-like